MLSIESLSRQFLDFTTSQEGREIADYLRTNGKTIGIGYLDRHATGEETSWTFGFGGFGFQKWEDGATIPWAPHAGHSGELSWAPRTQSLDAEQFAEIVRAKGWDSGDVVLNGIRGWYAQFKHEDECRKRSTKRNGQITLAVLAIMIVTLLAFALMYQHP